MPSILAMVGIVATVTQMLRGALTKYIEIKGILAQILAGVVSFGVVAYFYITTKTPFDMHYVEVAIQVAVYAIFGYKAIKAAARPKTI